MLEYIEKSSLCRNAEVALAALKSFQEILQINKTKNDNDSGVPSPSEEVISRSGEPITQNATSNTEYDLSLWTTAWKVWLNIGTNTTLVSSSEIKSQKVYIPSQAFLTALVQTFPPLFEHIKTRFVAADLQKLSTVLKSALCVPVHSDSSLFILPIYPEMNLTPLQEASLQAIDVLIKVSRDWKIWFG